MGPLSARLLLSLMEMRQDYRYCMIPGETALVLKSVKYGNRIARGTVALRCRPRLLHLINGPCHDRAKKLDSNQDHTVLPGMNVARPVKVWPSLGRTLTSRQRAAGERI